MPTPDDPTGAYSQWMQAERGNRFRGPTFSPHTYQSPDWSQLKPIAPLQNNFSAADLGIMDDNQIRQQANAQTQAPPQQNAWDRAGVDDMMYRPFGRNSLGQNQGQDNGMYTQMLVKLLGQLGGNNGTP